MSKLGLKGRGMRDQIADICWIIEKTREFQKNIYICFTKYTKVFVFSSAQSLSRISLCDSMDCSMPGFPVHHQLLKLTQIHLIELVMPSNHFILCRPLLHLPSIIPSIRVFSNELVLCIRWPKYWSFTFSISPSNEHSGLISFIFLI